MPHSGKTYIFSVTVNLQCFTNIPNKSNGFAKPFITSNSTEFRGNISKTLQITI